MSRSSTRSIETFAAIPVSVMTREPYRSLRASHKQVLLMLAAQYRGRNNGDLALTRKMAAVQFGLKNERTRTHALRELEQCGLIIKTNQGGITGHRPTLWALAWRKVDYFDGKHYSPPRTMSDLAKP